MRSFDRLIAAVAVILALIFAAAGFLLAGNKKESERIYRVELNRVEQELLAGREVSPSDYDTITGIYKFDGSEDFFISTDDYAVRSINGTLYRIDYNSTESSKAPRSKVYICLAAAAAVILGALLYVRQNIIRPFTKMKDLPAELAKGNLSVPLKENKGKYFGRFIWGMDMLREELETTRARELEHIKEEKTLLLSLSHDVKTPLSAIKLYSSAIRKGLYSEDKLMEAAGSISAKADEIEKYVSEMVTSAESDMLSFDIKATEFYLSSVIERLSVYYNDKLPKPLRIEDYSDCLIKCDPDRLEEVLQNLVENAIKYGDGDFISFSFSDEEDCRLISVSNSGCTLPQDELSHIFNSFWRGSNAGSKPGAGLGLYICRQLMLAMDGDIFAEISDGTMTVTVVCRKA